jgi:predicted ATPase
MKIQSLLYEDLSTGWKLDLIEFNPQLTLLVGASGVGKTKILKALQNLKKISQSGFSDFIKWDIRFITEGGFDYRWCGEFYWLTDDTLEYTDNDFLYIKYENVFINHELIINRTEDLTIFDKTETVKLSREESIIHILKEEPLIKTIHHAFNKISFYDIENTFDYKKKSALSDKDRKLKLARYKSLSDIRSCNESLLYKLYFLYENDKLSFDFIVNSYIDIFPHVEDLQIVLIISGSFNLSKEGIRPIPSIVGKEKQISHWIGENDLSSGMLKTFMQLAELYLSPDNSVILIDEFENSLGINCIDEVTYQILASERNLQFIITSHHPYIINKIPYQDWKLVTRNGSVVKAEDATKYGIGRSKHEAFTQLINLDAYAEGIAS